MSDNKDEKILELSKQINKMIIDFEKKYNEDIIVSAQAGMFEPKEYPDQPRVQLFRVFDKVVRV